MSEVIDDAVYEEPDQERGHELAVREGATTLFRSEEPEEILERAARTATLLAGVVRKQQLTVTIQGREHARVEAWTLLGSMLGVFPICVWTRKLEDGWEARVEARTRDGALIGAAEAECLRSESTWKNRDDYALRSMAQTRATSKALRQPLGFVMQLAGFDPTPAEEMPRHEATRDRDPYGFADSRADGEHATAHEQVRVHFGANSGKLVTELSQRSREWYAGDGWAAKKAESGRPVTDADRRLRHAARALSGLPVDETTGPFDSETDVPF